MPQLPIVAFEGSAAVVLPAPILELMGLRIGDVVDATLGDRQLILQPVEDAGRRKQMEAIIKEVFEHRQDAYHRLA